MCHTQEVSSALRQLSSSICNIGTAPTLFVLSCAPTMYANESAVYALSHACHADVQSHAVQHANSIGVNVVHLSLAPPEHEGSHARQPHSQQQLQHATSSTCACASPYTGAHHP